jgi:hypothetical protein
MNTEGTLWRSLAERDGSNQGGVQPEFDAPFEEPTQPERRQFLQIMGASTALSLAATGCRWEKDNLLPFAQNPEGYVPGVPRFLSTAMEHQGFGIGLRVKSYDGRPIKVDGNPAHPDSQGASGAWHQASVLELYDPDRSRGYARRNESTGLVDSTALEFKVGAKKVFDELRASQGTGLRILSGTSFSPSRADMRARFLTAFPNAKWIEYEPLANHNEVEGARLAFGRPVHTRYRLTTARVIVSLGCDLLASRADSLSLSRQWADGRQPESGEMNRMYVFESFLTQTGAAADHRHAIRARHIKALTAHLDAELSAKLGVTGGQPRPQAAFLLEPKLRRLLDVLISDVVAAKGRSVFSWVGSNRPKCTHSATG